MEKTVGDEMREMLHDPRVRAVRGRMGSDPGALGWSALADLAEETGHLRAAAYYREYAADRAYLTTHEGW